MPRKRRPSNHDLPHLGDGIEEEEYLASVREMDEVMELYNKHLARHPEYAAFLDCPEAECHEYVDESGQEVSPSVHIHLHVVLEKQLRLDDTAFVRETLDRLLARGVDRHEAEHAILNVLVHELWRMLKHNRPYDGERYQKELKKL